jgi:hypothetical protein
MSLAFVTSGGHAVSAEASGAVTTTASVMSDASSLFKISLLLIL